MKDAGVCYASERWFVIVLLLAWIVVIEQNIWVEKDESVEISHGGHQHRGVMSMIEVAHQLLALITDPT